MSHGVDINKCTTLDELDVDITDTREVRELELSDSVFPLYRAYQNSASVSEKTAKNTRLGVSWFERFTRDTDATWNQVDQGTQININISENISSSALDKYTIIDMWIQHLIEETELAKSTLKVYYKGLSQFCTFLEEKGYIEQSPFYYSKISDYVDNNFSVQSDEWDTSGPIAFTPDQVGSLIENVPAPRGRNEVIVKLAYSTGMRRSELAALKLDDVDLEEQGIAVPDTKTDDHDPVFIDSHMRDVLAEYKNIHRKSLSCHKESEYYFVSNHEASLRGSRINEIIVDTADKIGVQEYYTDAKGKERAKYTSHSLRSGFATNWVEQEGDIHQLSKALGHSDSSVTEARYVDTREEHEKRIMIEHAPEFERN